MPNPLDETFVPHIGWLSHQTGDEVSRLLREGHFESAEQAFFWRFLRDDDTVIDCGAHIGLYSVLAARIVGGRGKVLSFEPNPDTAGILESNVRAACGGPVSIHRKALSSRRGTAQLSREKQGFSAHSTIVERSDGNTYSIETETIDSIVGAGRDTVVALLKIDAEGHETEILDGAKETLAAGNIQVIMLEFTENVLQKRGLDSQRLAKTVEALNLTLCRYSPGRNRLEAAKIAEPVWYENLFAARDLEAANQRLATAPAAQERIAIEILKRAQACNLYNELEELDRYKSEAKLASEFHEWAKRSDARLAGESKLAEANRAWAEKTEALLAAERTRASALEDWAKRSDARLAGESKLAEANRAWAEKTEALLAAERTRASAFEDWAKRSDARLADASKLAAANEHWALQTEQLLAAERETCAKHLAWAQNVERLLKEERAARATT